MANNLRLLDFPIFSRLKNKGKFIMGTTLKAIYIEMDARCLYNFGKRKGEL